MYINTFTWVNERVSIALYLCYTYLRLRLFRYVKMLSIY